MLVVVCFELSLIHIFGKYNELNLYFIAGVCLSVGAKRQPCIKTSTRHDLKIKFCSLF